MTERPQDEASSPTPGEREPRPDGHDGDDVEPSGDEGADVAPNGSSDEGPDDGGSTETSPFEATFAGDTELADVDALALEDVVADRPIEAAAPIRGPVALAGTGVAGFLMGTAEVIPGFSGGTVALVVGIYERLIANVRQGARALSLLVRGRVDGALRALLAIEWAFVAALLVGMFAAIFTVAGTLSRLIEEEPTLLKSALFGLVLGAAVLAGRELRAGTAWHVLLGVVVAFGTFVGLGQTGGVFLEPSVLTFFIGAAIAVCAWILPGVSGSFLLLLLGLWQPVVDAVADLNVGLLLVFAVGCVVGLASFSTLLNWLMARYHDLVLAALIGLMVGSVRVLWPYPTDAPFENVQLGAPEGTDALLAMAVGLTAFSLVWMVGLLATGIQRRRARRVAVISDAGGHPDEQEDPDEADAQPRRP